jgi:hypothetical protein
MARTRTTLSGRTGWTAVAGLSTVLAVVVAGQLPAASAQERPAPVSSAFGPLLPSLAPTAGPAIAPELRPVPAVTGPSAGQRGDIRSGDDRPSGPLRATTPVAPAAPAAPAKPVAPRTAADPAAAGTCSGAGWQQRRGRAALVSLRPGAADRTGFRIEFLAARAGYMGLTHLKERRIEMFVRVCGTQSDELLRHVMAHELGHAYDTARMTTATRKAWLSARSIPSGTNWYGCSGCSDFATPAGDFAEVYAQWARGASTNRSRLAGDVPPGQLAALAKQFFGA